MAIQGSPRRGAHVTAHPPESAVDCAEGATHCPLGSQTLGLAQSLMLAHIGLHVPVLAHLYGVQSCVLPFALVVV
jgi:hypothetical protein